MPESIDNAIIRVLKEAKEPLTTYQIAKKLGISWSTANTHCYRLKDAGKIDCEYRIARIGESKKVYWKLKERK